MHRGHDHHHHHHDGGGHGGAGAGHNHAHPPRRPAQWQTPHQPADGGASRIEPDLDLVGTAFVEAFLTAQDPTSFLRLAQVPFEGRAPDGARLVLLRVEVEALADVGAVTPQLGGAGFRYDPLPARMVSRRKRLRFSYFDGAAVRALTFGEARELVMITGDGGDLTMER